MSEQPPSPETLLAVSLEITSSAERRAYLDRACAGNETLRQEVESLLAAHEQAGAFMSSEAVKATLPLPPTEKAGHRIGRYKLLEQIGEGGFGRADVLHPVERGRGRGWRGAPDGAGCGANTPSYETP